jgi:hypothetical protein
MPKTLDNLTIFMYLELGGGLLTMGYLDNLDNECSNKYEKKS